MLTLVVASAQSTWTMLAVLAARITSLTAPGVLLSVVLMAIHKMPE